MDTLVSQVSVSICICHLGIFNKDLILNICEDLVQIVNARLDI